MANTNNNPSDEFIADAVVTRKSRLSLVWLIPIVALLIGVALVYKYYSQKGETLTILFNTAGGITAGKTKVRLRDVDVGQVTNVTVTPDLLHAIVTVELVHGSSKYLNDKTVFWLERPRLSLTEVSGLGTLLGGVYIGVEPGVGGKPTDQFIALPEPPIVSRDEKGRFFTLNADDRGSLVKGSPVYFHGFDAGKVVDTRLAEDKKQVDIRVFIAAPYDDYVYANTRFWNVSGVQVDAGAGGIKVKTESLVSILLGGLTFDVPKQEERGQVAMEDAKFTLYASQEEAFAKHYTKSKMVLFFNESVRGLSVGAPVTVRGMPYGRVVDIRAVYDTKNLTLRIPVTVEVEPDRFEHVGNVTKNTQLERMKLLLAKGLRAQLKTGSLLTGQQYIDVDFHQDAPPAKLAMFDGLPVFPTIPTTLDSLTDRLGVISGNVESITQQFRDDVTPEVTGTLQELKEAARSLRLMADYLERHPEALLSGKKGRK
jgi:paraquat-inducible protein B